MTLVNVQQTIASYFWYMFKHQTQSIMKRKILFIALMMIIKVIPVSAQEDWKLQKDKDGIQVYSAAIPDSKIRAIKVVANYIASPEEIADISRTFPCQDRNREVAIWDTLAMMISSWAEKSKQDYRQGV